MIDEKAVRPLSNYSFVASIPLEQEDTTHKCLLSTSMVGFTIFLYRENHPCVMRVGHFSRNK